MNALVAVYCSTFNPARPASDLTSCFLCEALSPLRTPRTSPRRFPPKTFFQFPICKNLHLTVFCVSRTLLQNPHLHLNYLDHRHHYSCPPVPTVPAVVQRLQDCFREQAPPRFAENAQMRNDTNSVHNSPPPSARCSAAIMQMSRFKQPFTSAAAGRRLYLPFR